MAINLLDSKPVFGDDPSAGGYTGVPAAELAAWLCVYEAGIHDPDPVEGEYGRIQLTSATYDVEQGLVVEAWGKRYRLRVTAEEL